MGQNERRIAALLCAGVFLTGCAQAPKSTIVAQKDVERLAEKAIETDSERDSIVKNRETAPEHYTFETKNANGTFSLKADANVILPEVERLPMYYLQCDGFTQEQVTGIYDYLFAGKDTYVMEGTDYTKSECEKEIIALRQELAELETGTEAEAHQKQDLENTLKYLEEEYDDLPEESTLKKVKVDATMTDRTFQTDGEDGEIAEIVCKGLECETEDGAFLSLNNFPVDASGWPDLIYDAPTELSYIPGEGTAVTAKEADGKMKKGMTMTCAHACELGDGLFAAAGIDAKLAQILIQKGYKESGFEEDDTYKIENSQEYTAFMLVYTRVIGGTPVAATTSTVVSEDREALIWNYEQIYVQVTEERITGVNWQFPVSLKEKAAEDANILPFADAAVIFEEMTPLIYGGKLADWSGDLSEKTEDAVTVSIDVNVNRIELNLMWVKSSGAERTGLYVPAWVFYGEETTTFHGNGGQDEEPNTESQPWIVLAVNAVDGTVIDVVEGY